MGILATNILLHTHLILTTEVRCIAKRHFGGTPVAPHLFRPEITTNEVEGLGFWALPLLFNGQLKRRGILTGGSSEPEEQLGAKAGPGILEERMLKVPPLQVRNYEVLLSDLY